MGELKAKTAVSHFYGYDKHGWGLGKTINLATQLSSSRYIYFNIKNTKIIVLFTISTYYTL